MTKEEFEKLSKKEQRVAIAKDVVERVRAKKILAEGGTYLDVDVESGASVTSETLTSVLEVQSCRACALGALLASRVMLGNVEGVPVYNNGSQSARVASVVDCEKFLDAIFDSDVLCNIQAAFERWHPYSRKCNITAVDDRLVAIMQDIVDHDGEFTLTPETFE